jgi:hypothetical protein
MEEEKGIGNIIFYIVAAIIAVISSIKNKKKVPAGKPPGYPQPSNKPGGFPDDMFDEPEEVPYGYEEVPEPYIVIPEPVAAAVTSVFTPEMEGSHSASTAEKFSGEGVSALDHIETARRFEELVRQTETVVYDIKEADLYDYDLAEVEEPMDDFEDFDARKAIVWATIIERKEY